MTVTFYRKQEDGKVQYYSIHDRQGDFFTPFVLTAVWGNDLNTGRVKVFTFKNSEELDKKLRNVFLSRVRNGYKVLYSFARSAKHKKMFEELGKASSG
jgi:hypothetical protein